MPTMRFLALALLLFALAACASYPKNASIEKIDPKTGYRFDNLAANDNSDSVFVIVTFSGGGTRAAALSYGVLETLRTTEIQVDGRKKSLLSEVDVISSVSGGSFTSAYYGLFRDRVFLERDDPAGFENRFLYRDIEGELLALLFNPANWLRLASPTFGRIDLASELYSRTIFDEKTFAALKAAGKPYLMINATDMSQGVPFTFVQDQFDYLCSDLGPFKVGRAVAASSDFPVAFTPLQLNNYAAGCEFKKPIWIRLAEKDRDFSKNPGRSARARVAWSYRDEEQHPYIHLLDGGVADNIGLRGPLTAIRSTDPRFSVLRMISNKKIDTLVVIIVDAKTRPESTFDKDPSPPGLFTVLETISTVPLDNYSFDTIDLLRTEFQQWRKDRINMWRDPRQTFKPCPPAPDNPDGPKLHPVDLFAIYVGFDQIADPERRHKFLTLPTTFVLPAKEVDALRAVGKEILEDTPQFSDLVGCLNK